MHPAPPQRQFTLGFQTVSQDGYALSLRRALVQGRVATVCKAQRRRGDAVLTAT